MIPAILVSPWAGLAQTEKLPMPPTFAHDPDIEQTLRTFPLGIIAGRAAFSQHYKAHREMSVANGLQGWVYHGGGIPKEGSSVNLTRKKRVIEETRMGHAVRTYTLIDKRGVVIDVPCDEQGRHDGLTARSPQQI